MSPPDDSGFCLLVGGCWFHVSHTRYQTFLPPGWLDPRFFIPRRALTTISYREAIAYSLCYNGPSGSVNFPFSPPVVEFHPETPRSLPFPCHVWVPPPRPVGFDPNPPSVLFFFPSCPPPFRNDTYILSLSHNFPTRYRRDSSRNVPFRTVARYLPPSWWFCSCR